VSEIDELREELESARAELLDVCAGISPEAFVHRAPAASGDGECWSIRETLWHVGLMEDWLRRATSKALSGDPVPAYHRRPPPEIASTVEYMLEWLEQARRPMLALLRRLPEDQLDIEVTLPGGEVSSARQLIRRIARHDREHTTHIRMLRELANAAPASD